MPRETEYDVYLQSMSLHFNKSSVINLWRHMELWSLKSSHNRLFVWQFVLATIKDPDHRWIPHTKDK